MNRSVIIAVVAGVVAAVVIAAVFMRGSRGAVTAKVEPNASVTALVAMARDSETKGDFTQAKATYQKLVAEHANASEVMNWQKKIEDLNIRLLFSPALTPKSTTYEIKPGDTLTKIARQFKTTTELIMKSNNLPSDRIVPGKRVKVWTAPFSILVYKGQNMLILKSEDEIVKTYIVSTGANNSTPVGTFKIVNKLPNPTWFKAGAVVAPGSPENVLGTRWLGFDIPSYGIHGTIEPQSLGRQVTQGCVRMANPDVEELYAIVPVGTLVTIVD